MRVHSVNVGLPQEISDGKRTVMSGIYKSPVGGRVMARRLNLEGDGQADLNAHGGEQRAIYAYPWLHYPYWADILQIDGFPPGAFGENLTLDETSEDEVCIGDRYRVGEGSGGAVLEVTQPRPPCSKLELRLGTSGFIKRFLQSGKVGFYLRVIAEGEIGAGDLMEQIAEGPERMSVRFISDLLHFDASNVADAERALRIPALSPGWRQSFQKRVEGLTKAPPEPAP